MAILQARTRSPHSRFTQRCHFFQTGVRQLPIPSRKALIIWGNRCPQAPLVPTQPTLPPSRNPAVPPTTKGMVTPVSPSGPGEVLLCSSQHVFIVKISVSRRWVDHHAHLGACLTCMKIKIYLKTLFSTCVNMLSFFRFYNLHWIYIATVSLTLNIFVTSFDSKLSSLKKIRVSCLISYIFYFKIVYRNWVADYFSIAWKLLGKFAWK